ncbi:ABC transporter substrate-binding protein [Falsiroseomonas sp. HW251]|uniref:ABC transporter substrate-binding protein n=1 Tax=Falsiroseomonas sp. HW251 TaxID=3390998 RepID=UPI003D321310
MRRLSVLLNSGFAGPHAGFFLAEADGQLAAEGLAVEWRPGRGAAAVVEDMQGCDAAYGDMAALIARLGHEAPGIGPVAAFVPFGETPLTIAVAADGPVHRAADLAERRVSGHARDAALVAFPAFARRGGIDTASVAFLPSAATLAEQARAMVEDGAAEGVFGFVNTILASLEASGLDHIAPRLRFLRYAETCPELMGNALIVSRALAAEAGVVDRLLRAVARGFASAVADPVRGVAAVAACAPIHLTAETRRWQRTIAAEMAHPDAARLGLGRVDPARVAAACALLTDTLPLPRRPDAAEVYRPDWR